MSAMREELHHLVDRLPEEKVALLLRLVRDQFDERPIIRDLPFIGMLEAEPDFAERSEEVLRSCVPSRTAPGLTDDGTQARVACRGMPFVGRPPEEIT
ncbi:hypothetical protein ACFXJ8_36205 [Nonomuraea sp. NPDC059194]|uniref:hypothetical protein n=1 Tax=Nonomuraea sp. NPDC059194 TaxID=3346764 RepID=UPI00367C2A5C